MSEPIKHGDEWWTQGSDGSWLRWNAAEYRWDPQPGAPPFTPPPPADAVSPPPDPPPPDLAAAPSDLPHAEVAAPPPDVAAAAAVPAGSPALRDFEPATGKARVAMVFIGVVAVTGLVRGLMLFQRMGSDSLLLENSPTLAAIATFYLFAILASAIASIVWFKAAYDNVAPLGASSLRYTTGWAIGAWFIPIGNMFIPKQIADDMWRASDPALPREPGATWKFTPVAGLLHLWWAAWIARWVLTVAGDATSASAIEAQDLEAYRTGTGLIAAGDLAMAAAGVLFIRIIHGITTRQRERARMLQTEVENPAPAQP